MEAALEARCGKHPERVAVWTCPRCGGFACAECAAADPTGAVCAACIESGHADYPIPFETTRPDAPRGYWRTVWASMRAAPDFFGRFPLRGSLVRAFAFVAATVGLGHVPIAFCCFGLSAAVVTKFMPTLGQNVQAGVGAIVGAAFAFYFFMSILFAFFLVGLGIVLVDVGARVTGGKNVSAGVTARAVSYMQAPLLLQFTGYASCFGLAYWLVYFGWVGACTYFLLTRRYRTSQGAAVFVAALPGAIVGGLVTLFFVLTLALPQLLTQH